MSRVLVVDDVKLNRDIARALLGGMPRDVVAQAIDPFYTTKKRGQGTGLGLTAAHGIIAQTGGHLSITSAPGEGTFVHIRIPVSTTTATSSPSLPAVTSVNQIAPTILVADDDEDIRVIVERILTKAGYTVITANDGQHAITTAQQHPGAIDCLITDVMMPVMNGQELARRFTTSHPETPILFISGYAAALINMQGILDPGSTVITKPFTKADLLEAVEKVLESALSGRA